MDETKSISPEAKGLFETIRQQAKQYEQAFIFLEEQQKKLEQLRQDLESYLNLIKSQADEVFVNLSRGIYDTLSSLESKSEKINKIYDELENIKEIKNNLLNFQDSIKKYSLELSSAVPTIRAKAESEISATLHEIKTNAEKEIESELQKMEVRIGMRFKNIETKLFNYDQKLLSITDYQSREFRNLSEEIDALKSRVNSIKLLVDDSRKHLEKFTREIEQNINEKIIYIEQIIQGIESTTKTISVSPDFFIPSSSPQQTTPATSPQKTDSNLDYYFDVLKNEIKQLNDKNTKLNNKIEELTKKNDLSYYLAIIAIALAVVFLILSFVL